MIKPGNVSQKRFNYLKNAGRCATEADKRSIGVLKLINPDHNAASMLGLFAP
jgi:hypothetical protein